MKIATNIQWDTDGDKKLAAKLPQQIAIPNDISEENEISDYISDETGFCHFGFDIKEV